MRRLIFTKMVHFLFLVCIFALLESTAKTQPTTFGMSAQHNIAPQTTIPNASGALNLARDTLPNSEQNNLNPGRCLDATTTGYPGQASNTGTDTSTARGLAIAGINMGTSAANSFMNARGNVATGLAGVFSGLNLSCALSNVSSSCPSMPSDVPEVPDSCSVVSVGGTFNSAKLIERINSFNTYRCAALCQKDQAAIAANRLGCLQEEYEKMDTAMRRVDARIRETLTQQKTYVDALETEVARQRVIAESLIGTDGNGGKAGELDGAIGAMNSRIQQMTTVIPQIAQRVRDYRLKQERLTAARERVAVSTAFECFRNGRPTAMSVTGIREGDGAPGTGLEYITAVYRDQLQNHSPNPGAGVRRVADNKLRALTTALNQRLGQSSPYVGTPSIRQALDEPRTGSQLNVNMTTLQNDLNIAIRQAGLPGPIASMTRNLLNMCVQQTQANLAAGDSSQASEMSAIRQELRNEVTRVIAGEAPKGGGAPSGGVAALVLSYTNDLDNTFLKLRGTPSGFNSSTCTTIRTMTNSGSVSYSENSLDAAESCLNTLNATARCVLNGGDTCVGGQSGFTAINIPNYKNLPCNTLMSCRAAVAQEGLAARNRSNEIQGDGTFAHDACGGRCPGKVLFIRQASANLMNDVRSHAQTYNDAALKMRNQLLGVNSVCRSMGLSCGIPTSPDPNAQPWDCPVGATAGSTAQARGPDGGAQLQLCSMPTPNTRDALLNLTTPPIPGEVREKLQASVGTLTQKRDDLNTRLNTLANLLPKFQELEVKCRAEEAARGLASLTESIHSGYEACSGNHATIDRDEFCTDSRLGELGRDLANVMAALRRDSSGSTRDSMREASTATRELASLRTKCRSNRTPGQVAQETNLCGILSGDAETRGRLVRECGAETAITREEDLTGVSANENFRGRSVAVRAAQGEGATGQCFMPGAICRIGTISVPSDDGGARECVQKPICGTGKRFDYEQTKCVCVTGTPGQPADGTEQGRFDERITCGGTATTPTVAGTEAAPDRSPAAEASTNPAAPTPDAPSDRPTVRTNTRRQTVRGSSP